MNRQAQLIYLLDKRENLRLQLDKEPQFPWSIYTEIQLLNKGIEALLNSPKKDKMDIREKIARKIAFICGDDYNAYNEEDKESCLWWADEILTDIKEAGWIPPNQEKEIR